MNQYNNNRAVFNDLSHSKNMNQTPISQAKVDPNAKFPNN